MSRRGCSCGGRPGGVPCRRYWREVVRWSNGWDDRGRQRDGRVCLWPRRRAWWDRCATEGRGRRCCGGRRGRYHWGGDGGRRVQLGRRGSPSRRFGVGARGNGERCRTKTIRRSIRKSCTGVGPGGRVGVGRVLRVGGLRRLREGAMRREGVGHGRYGGARRFLEGWRLQGRRRGRIRLGSSRRGSSRLSSNWRGGLRLSKGSRGLGAIRGRGDAGVLRRCQRLSCRRRRRRGDVAEARRVDGSRLVSRRFEGAAFEAQRLECAESSRVRAHRRGRRLLAGDGLSHLCAGALAESPAIATKSAVGTARGTSPLTDIRLIVHALPSKVRPILTRRNCAYRATTPASVFLPRRRTAKRENRKRLPIASPTSVTFTLLQ